MPGTAPLVMSVGRCKVLVRCGLLLAISLWCFARAVVMVHNQHRIPTSLDEHGGRAPCVCTELAASSHAYIRRPAPSSIYSDRYRSRKTVGATLIENFGEGQ